MLRIGVARNRGRQTVTRRRRPVRDTETPADREGNSGAPMASRSAGFDVPPAPPASNHTKVSPKDPPELLIWRLSRFGSNVRKRHHPSFTGKRLRHRGRGFPGITPTEIRRVVLSAGPFAWQIFRPEVKHPCSATEYRYQAMTKRS